MSNESNILELEEFTATSFAGISSSHPVVIDFTKRRKNQNIVEFTGDQGAGKSSTLMGILYAMGATFDIDKKKLLNREDGALDVNLKFTYDGDQYQVVANDKRTELKKLGENGKWKTEDSPVAMLRKIFGPVGLSPFSLKSMKGKDQIKFFQTMFGSGEDASKKMQAVEKEIDEKFSLRRDVNRDVKALSSALELEPLFQKYEASQERFKTVTNAEKEKKKFDDLAKKKADYDRYKANLDLLKAGLTDTQSKIQRLKAELAAAEAEEIEVSERIEKGNKWMEDNEIILSDYEAANKEWLNLSQKLADYEKWKDILRREKQLNEKQELAVTYDGELVDLREKLLKLTKSCLPKVEGLTVKVAAGLDKTDQPEGVFYTVPGKEDEQPIHELSQSEFESMWAKILVAADMNFLFFENLSDFGSMTLGLFNELSKEGIIIFGTRTNPSIKEMGIAFKTKIEYK
jgi:hypothetical protein